MPFKFLTLARVGAISTFRFLIKHWYLFFVLIAILPGIYGSIKEASETNNPTLPVIQLGLRLTNADADISKDVDTLYRNPIELIGVEKPTKGIWKTIVYWWKVWWNVIWRFLGNIFLISVPFVLFYKLFSWRQTSEPAKNLFLSIIYGLIFVFIINLVIVIHGFMTGNSMIVIPGEMTFFQETYFIIKNTLPFHGIFKLITYLIYLL